jgi:hypothetical protein
MLEKKSTDKTRYKAADNKPENRSMIEMATTIPISTKDRFEIIELDSRCDAYRANVVKVDPKGSKRNRPPLP